MCYRCWSGGRGGRCKRGRRGLRVRVRVVEEGLGMMVVEEVVLEVEGIGEVVEEGGIVVGGEG